MVAKKAPAVLPSTQFGVPSGRLLELQRETKLPEPYVVTDTITIAPLTKDRADKCRESQMVILIYNQLLNEALRGNATEEILSGLTKQVREAEQAYHDAFFGDQAEAVTAFFRTQDDQLWTLFQRDITARFFPNQPVDGKCASCGHVIDEDTAGKAEASSA
jgi:hypothetical protein